MTITHNGKEITLTAEQEKALFGEDKHRTGYERAEFEESYYLTNAQGETLRFVESGSSYENDVYEAVNYHSDKTIAQNNARADALMRNLRRFSAEHEGWKIRHTHNRSNTRTHLIECSFPSNKLIVSSTVGYQQFGIPYFHTAEIAKAAIEQFKDELIWYFTEYKWVL